MTTFFLLLSKNSTFRKSRFIFINSTAVIKTKTKKKHAEGDDCNIMMMCTDHYETKKLQDWKKPWAFVAVVSPRFSYALTETNDGSSSVDSFCEQANARALETSC